MRQVLHELATIGITGVVHATVSADDPRHYLCVANFRALIVMRRNGRWVADVLLHKPLPDGVPNIVGTPDASLFPSRRAALHAGQDIVQRYMLLAQAFFVGNRAIVPTTRMVSRGSTAWKSEAHGSRNQGWIKGRAGDCSTVSFGTALPLTRRPGHHGIRRPLRRPSVRPAGQMVWVLMM